MENVKTDSNGNDNPDLKGSVRSNSTDQFNNSSGSSLNSKTNHSSADIARALPSNIDAKREF